ncbi:MAG: UvrD-helicase domain-containing protein, partial [Candidatus Dormibacteraceae bacterium]
MAKTLPSNLIEIDRFQTPLRVVAGPGTGKTHALVALYADLVGSGVPRGRILVLTFSTAAAGELERRIDERLLDSYDRAWISTFHSFCARLLRDHQPDPRRLLLSGFQEWVAMRQVLDEMDPALLGGLAPVRRSEAFAQDALAFVALLKQNLLHPAGVALLAETGGSDRMRALAAVYSAYQAALEAAHLVDFRDLVMGAISLLQSREGVLRALRDRFSHILVDEFQDVDPAQFSLLRLIAPPRARPRLVVVGDPDQSIYGFRGTLPRLLSHDFEITYGARSLSLDAGRRCPPSILA